MTRDDLCTLISERLRDPAALAAWLREQPAEARYQPGQGQHCPLHAYLRPGTEGSGYSPHVSPHAVWEDSYSCETLVSLPSWARAFVCAVDTEARALSPAEALAILERVTT